MNWQIIGIYAIRLVMFATVYAIAKYATNNTDEDNRVYWMFAAGFIVGRIWSMIGQ
jgi:prolipoprotein diacylglyceryltransferase